MSDKIEEDLLAANKQALSSGSITPLLKKELWLKIQSRRLSEGKEELVVPVTSASSEQISQAERAKKLRRREQNRRAARNFRTKQKNRHIDIQERIDFLEDSNQQLDQERMLLIRQKNDLLLQLCEHLQHCQVRPPPSLPPSSPPEPRHQLQDPETPSSPSPSPSCMPDPCQYSLSCQLCEQTAGHCKHTCHGSSIITTELSRNDVQTSSEGSVRSCQIWPSVLDPYSAGVSGPLAPRCGCDSRARSCLEDGSFSLNYDSISAEARHGACELSTLSPGEEASERTETGDNNRHRQSQCHRRETGDNNRHRQSQCHRRETGDNNRHRQSQCHRRETGDNNRHRQSQCHRRETGDNNRHRQSQCHRRETGDNNRHRQSQCHRRDGQSKWFEGCDTNRSSNACERPTSTVPHPLISRQPGFECGVMFLQIVDGKVRLVRGDESLKRLSMKINNTLAAEKTPYSGVTPPSDGAPPCTETPSCGGRPANETGTSSSKTPSCEQSPTCSSDTPASPTSKERSVTLYHLSMSEGLPFFILRNNLQTAGPFDGEDLESERADVVKTGNPLPQCSVQGPQSLHTVTLDGSTAMTQKQGHPMQPKAKPKRKVSKRDGNVEPPPGKKRRKKSETVVPSAESVPTAVLPNDHFAVYEDVEDGRPCSEGQVAAYSNSRTDQVLNPATETSLRDQTNIRNNGFKHDPAIPVRNVTALNKAEPCSVHKVRNSLSSIRHDQTSSLDVKSNRSSASRATSKVKTNSDTLPATLPVGYTQDEAVYEVPANCQPAAPQVNTTSRVKQTSPAHAAGESEFENFLTNCFDSLDTEKGGESAGRTQGLILLTSMEMPPLGAITGGTERKDADDRQDQRCDLPTVNTRWLMNVLREASGVDRTHTNSHQNAQGDREELFNGVSSTAWLFSGLKSLTLDSENPLTGTPTGRKDQPSSQGVCVLPVLSNNTEWAAELGLPRSSLSLPRRSSTTTNEGNEAAVAGDGVTGTTQTQQGTSGASTREMNGVHSTRCHTSGIRTTKHVACRSTGATGGMNEIVNTGVDMTGAPITLSQRTDGSGPDPCACNGSQVIAESMTLSWSEYSRLMDAFISSLATASSATSST